MCMDVGVCMCMDVGVYLCMGECDIVKVWRVSHGFNGSVLVSIRPVLVLLFSRR